LHIGLQHKNNGGCRREMSADVFTGEGETS
jgi:hypothetical protein